MKKTGVILLAAGLSSRMKTFKPLLPFENSTIAYHTVTMLKELGFAPIVVVTGYRGEELEAHLGATGARFVRNERYRETDMFESVRLGVSAIAGVCDQVMIMPMDIPAILPDTFRKLCSTEGKVIRTMYQGKPGHPMILDCKVARSILQYQGTDGLKGAIGAIETSGESICNVVVADGAVKKDVDTPEEYQELLEWNTKRKCCALWEKYKTPIAVREHCAAVWEEAQTYLDHSQVNRELIQSACLLHDLARTSPNHAEAGADILRKEGYESAAEIVSLHHDIEENAGIEAMIVYLADKHRKGTQYVSLEERFKGSQAKCHTQEAKMCHRKRYEQAQRIEQYILEWKRHNTEKGSDV